MPTQAQLQSFYKKEVVPKIREMLDDSYVFTGTGGNKAVAEAATNIRVMDENHISFNVPATFSYSAVKTLVKDSFMSESLADSEWEAKPGTGLVYGKNGVYGVIDIPDADVY